MAKLSAKEIIDSLKEMTLLEIKEVVDLMKYSQILSNL